MSKDYMATLIHACDNDLLNGKIIQATLAYICSGTLDILYICMKFPVYVYATIV